MVAAQSLRISGVAVDGDDIYWLEGRPAEGGRTVLVHRAPDGRTRDLVTAPFNVRSRVHEYGGGAFLVSRGVVHFSNFSDGRVYRCEPHLGDRASAGPAGQERDGGLPAPGAPAPLTPPGEFHYADFCADPQRDRVIAVREDHRAGTHVSTTIVAIGASGAVQVLAGGYDFYSTPRVSPDGATLSWICWSHPQMPWDGTELWVADLTAHGALAHAHRVAGGPDESIYAPGWTPDGQLIFAGDRTGWWQLYQVPGSAIREDAPDAAARWPQALIRNPPDRSEFGRPQWNFGTTTWACADPSHLVAAYAVDGVWHLGVVDLATRKLRDLPVGLEPQEWLTAAHGTALLVAASPLTPPALVRLHLRDGRVETVRATAEVGVERGYLSSPETVVFPTDDGSAHAFYYPPRHRDLAGPAGERPPLIAISHGGPTAAATRALDLRIQYWTSRGFAVVDVNYGGSTGFGRAYRERLRGRWGEVDVDDMVRAVTHLVAAGKADPARLIIRGGSAGGYTTLAALTFRPGVFKAGASYYGVSDLERLARDTHKFESRYLDSLVGPYPEDAAVYRARSPIHQTEALACPLIFFQGLEDRVVPPAQSEMMADAVRRKGLPVAYVAFEGEQHGFRQAPNIVRCLEAELTFYAKVFMLVTAEPPAPLSIDNL